MPIRSRLLGRLINKAGDPATYRLKTISGEDSHGDDTYTDTDVPITAVKSLVTNTRVPFMRQTEIGVARVMQVEFFTHDTLSAPNKAIGEQAIVIDVDGLEYEVMYTEPSQVGAVRLICQSRRV
jgi:hypothetical protein